MTQRKNISILIVTHNHSHYIDMLLDSLMKFDYKNAYFCDACSNDDTVKKILNSPFKNNLLEKKVLEGFSKNNNDLIRFFNLETKYFLLLNPDTFFDVDFIEVLYRKMESDSNIGIAAPVLKYPDGRLQVTWKKFPNLFTVLKKRFGFLRAVNEIQLLGPDIDWCLGACMLIDKTLLKSNRNLLDERYRLYCEDIDICFEAHVRNKKVIGVSDTYVFHHLNETSAKKVFSKYNFWNIQSIIKFICKWNARYYKELFAKKH